MAKKIFVANWKMYLTCRTAEMWLRSNLPEIKILLDETPHELILAASYEALYLLMSIINTPKLKLSAQNCAYLESGAHTGQVSVLSLKELGCSYCIVGHSECRIFSGETNETIAHKVGLLLDNGIIPIICIGETAHERASRKTFSVLEEQLRDVMIVLKKKQRINYTVCFAYEPVWVIGGKSPPYVYELNETINFIREFLNKQMLIMTYKILYGGSVNEQTMGLLSQVPGIDGYLMGRASLDFQVLKKIVLS